MSDLTDRQAAIDALGERPMVWTDSDYELGQRNQYDSDKLHLELVPSAQQWIPCSERLPEEYGEYYITWMTSSSKRPFVAICEGEVTGEYDHKHNRFKFEWLLEDYIKACPNVEVIAWMPLPEPYKGEIKNEIN